MQITHGSILAIFFMASEAEKAEGRDWYPRANRIASAISAGYKRRCGIETAAGVLAALSPNNRWDKNVRDAEALTKVICAGGDPDSVKVSTFNKNKKKAVEILSGEHPLNVLGGLKVRSFYQCILGNDAVCVDGHAYSIWTGQRVPTTKTPSISEKLYEKIETDYRLAAEQISSITGECYTAREVQAITWVVWRNMHAKADG
ncbi:MAG: DUF7178 family protein [Candidatus Fonsibacter ubiquis]